MPRPEPGRRRRQDPSDQPEKLGSVLGALLGTGRWGSGMVLGELGRRWGEVVGERVARESHPVRLEGGTLWIRASSGAWGAQLNFLAREIRTRANDVAGSAAISRIRVVLGGPAGPD